jgi:hypothetical protein
VTTGSDEVLAENKDCPGCKESKPVTAFGRNSARKDGLAYYCKQCFGEVSARSYRKRRRAEGKDVRERREAPPGQRWCPDCADFLPLERFGLNASAPTGLAGYCLTHQGRRSDESRDRVHGSRRGYRLKSRYGVTESEVNDMLLRLAALCPICRRGLGVKPHVDHDHETGEVRGLLCFTCNVGLGNFGDDVERLRRGALYLQGTLTAPSRIAEGVYDVAGFGWRRVSQSAEDLAADG